MAKGRRPNKMTTGAPPPRMQPGDIVRVTPGDGSNWLGVKQGMIHKVYPSAGAEIKVLDVWFGDYDVETEAPIIVAVLPERIVIKG